MAVFDTCGKCSQHAKLLEQSKSSKLFSPSPFPVLRPRLTPCSSLLLQSGYHLLIALSGFGLFAVRSACKASRDKSRPFPRFPAQFTHQGYGCLRDFAAFCQLIHLIRLVARYSPFGLSSKTRACPTYKICASGNRLHRSGLILYFCRRFVKSKFQKNFCLGARVKFVIHFTSISNLPNN